MTPFLRSRVHRLQASRGRQSASHGPAPFSPTRSARGQHLPRCAPRLVPSCPRASAPAGSAQGRGCPSDSPETAGLFPEPPRPGPSPSTATPNTACSTYSHDRFLSHAPEGEGFCLFRSLGCTPCPAQGLAHSRASLVNLMTKCHDCYPGIRALPLRVERPWRRPWPWPPVSDRGQSQALGQLRLASALEIWGSPARRLPRCARSMLPPGSEPTSTSIPSPVACLLRFSCSRKGSEPPLKTASPKPIWSSDATSKLRGADRFLRKVCVCVCRGGRGGSAERWAGSGALAATRLRPAPLD